MPGAIVIYETKNGATRAIAEAIQAGLKEAGIKADLKKSGEVDLAKLTGYQAVILGAPTYHKQIYENMKVFLNKIDSSALKGKIGAAFGAYGWSGESHEILAETMTGSFGMQLVQPGVKLAGTSGAASLIQHKDFAREIAEQIKSRS